MRGIFTREERAVVLFVAACLLVGALVTAVGRVAPSAVPDFSGRESESGRPVQEPEPGPVDVNSATVDELVRLQGVGPVRASEIVRTRDERGGFKSLDDLLEVKGIGPVTLEKLRVGATVGSYGRAAADSLEETSSEYAPDE